MFTEPALTCSSFGRFSEIYISYPVGGMDLKACLAQIIVREDTPTHCCWFFSQCQGWSSRAGAQHPPAHCCSGSVSQCPVSVTGRANPEQCRHQHLVKLLCLVAFFWFFFWFNPASSNFCVFLLQPLVSVFGIAEIQAGNPLSFKIQCRQRYLFFSHSFYPCKA